MNKPRIRICPQNTTYAISLQLLCYGTEIEGKELVAHSAKDTEDLLFADLLLKIKSKGKGGKNMQSLKNTTYINPLAKLNNCFCFPFMEYHQWKLLMQVDKPTNGFFQLE
jgi:hypothetical protein